MKILRRISVIFAFCSIIASAVCANAQIVQVCDLGAGALVEKSNIVFSLLKMPLRLRDFRHVGKTSPESPYDIYIAVGGQKGAGAIVSFFCNDTGSVSKITIISNGRSPDASRNAGFTLGALLVSLGLSPSEVDVLMERKPPNSSYADVWAAKINRRILLEYDLEKARNGALILFLGLTASDK